MLVREAHVSSRSNLVLAAKPPAPPPGCVPVNRDMGRAHLPQVEVVRLSGHEPVQPSQDHLRSQFVERLWRSLKYEEVHLHAYEGVAAARAGLGRYFRFYTLLSQQSQDN